MSYKNGQQNVAIIPARKGSKSIPNKNIVDFKGKPLIAWTIELALQSKKISRVIVSTDCENIARISKSFGAEVPFIRPSVLAEDATPMEPVLNHAVEWLEQNEKYKVDSVVLLVPTCPLRRLNHIEKCIDLFHEKSLDCVFTSNEIPAHYTPYWAIRVDESQKALSFNGQDLRDGYKSRQEFPSICYAKNDLAYVLSPDNLKHKTPSVFGNKNSLINTNRIFDCDINEPEDLPIALALFDYLQKNETSD